LDNILYPENGFKNGYYRQYKYIFICFCLKRRKFSLNKYTYTKSVHFSVLIVSLVA